MGIGKEFAKVGSGKRGKHSALISKPGFTHDDQNKGHSIGQGQKTAGFRVNDPKGAVAHGKDRSDAGMPPLMGQPGVPKKRGSKLQNKWGQGHSNSAGTHSDSFKSGPRVGSAPHVFNKPPATGAYCFRAGQVKRGNLRLSGSKSAHRIGAR